MRKLWIWAGAAAAAALALALFLTMGRGQSVTVSPVVRGQAVEAVYATGVVEPETWAKVSPTISVG